MKRTFLIALAAALSGLHIAPERAAAKCDIYSYVRTKLERASAFQTSRVTYVERSAQYKDEQERNRYQLAYNKLGPVVVQYAHNLLVQAAKDPKSKIILPRGEGTLTYEAMLALIKRFSGKDGPYGDTFDPKRILLVDLSQELVKEARAGGKWGGKNPDDLIYEMLKQKGVEEGDKLIWAGVWDNGEKGAEFAYLKEISDKFKVAASDQRLMLVTPGNLSGGVGSICLDCGNSQAWQTLFRPETRDQTAYHLFTLTGRAKGDPIPYQLKYDGKKVVAVTKTSKQLDPQSGKQVDVPSVVVGEYKPFAGDLPETNDPTYPAKWKIARGSQRELGVTDVVRAVNLNDLREGEREPGTSAANNPAIRRLTTHYGNFLNLMVPNGLKLGKVDPEAPTDWHPGMKTKLQPASQP